MTNPPERPGQSGWRGRGTSSPDPATHRILRQDAAEPPTEQLRARRSPQTGAGRAFPKPQSPADHSPTQQLRRADEPLPPQRRTAAPDSESTPKRPRSKQTVVLIAVIVVALLAGGLAGGELYARHRAESILVGVAECVVEDGASVSFGVNPPFLWQYAVGDYTDITVRTEGDRVQSANGMTAEVTLEDVRLTDTADSKGTIGSLRATLDWTSAGIKDTVVAELPQVGSFVTGVTTNSADGTIVLQAGENSVTAKPIVTDGDLNLEVLDVVGPLPRDFVQSSLNDLTRKLNDNYPLGIHADSVQVTESGVVGTFSSQDASIPREDANPCFAAL